MRDDEIRIEQDNNSKGIEEGPGIHIKQAPPIDTAPPLEGIEEGPGEAFQPGPEIQTMASGRMPLDPLVVTPLLRFEGELLAEMTKYKGWLYSQEEIDAAANLIRNCSIEMRPDMQLAVMLIGLHAAKGGGYLVWRRQGKPENMRVEPGEAA